MADSKISDLSAVTDVQATDNFVLARGGATKRLTGASLLAALPMVLISDTTLGADTASFDTNTILGGNIPGTYKHLRLVLNVRSTRTSNTEDQMSMRFNNDSGNNYDCQYSQTFAGGTSSAENMGQNSFNGGGSAPIANMPAADSPSGAAAQIIIDIVNYAGTTFRKCVASVCISALTDSGNGQRIWTFSGEWRSTAAITRIVCNPDNGNFLAGSRLTIYGLN